MKKLTLSNKSFTFKVHSLKIQQVRWWLTDQKFRLLKLENKLNLTLKAWFLKIYKLRNRKLMKGFGFLLITRDFWKKKILDTATKHAPKIKKPARKLGKIDKKNSCTSNKSHK